MTRLLPLLSLLLLSALSATATRPRKAWLNVRQPDGTTIRVSKRTFGPQSFCYVTQDGMLLRYNRAQALCYLTLQADSAVTTDYMAHETALRNADEMAWLNQGHALTTDEIEHLKPTASYSRTILTNRANTRTISDIGLGTYQESAGGMVSSIGAPEIPVIMVEFTDKKFQSFTTQEGVDRLFNEAGYTDNYGTVGSIRDYFTDNSDGLFTPHFNVLGTVTLPHDYAYYGANQGSNVDYNCYRIVQDALNLIAEQQIDLTPYAGTTGEIPLLAVYYAGMGEHVADYSAESENLIWAHYQSLGNSPASVQQNGRTFVVRSYLVGDEAWPDPASENYDPEQLIPGGNAVFVHEFCHALGLPDFYNTTNDSQVNGMLFWSIMDSGEWWGSGYHPVGMTAYERNFLGWLPITDLTAKEAQECSLEALGNAGATTPRAYRLPNPIEPKEYYILENRQPSRWYPAELGAGMLITHVDYSAYNWNSNIVNNTHTRERMNFVPADNSATPLDGTDQYTVRDFQGDLYPGITNNTEFSAQSTPSNLQLLYYNQDTTVAPLYNIRNENGIIRFHYLSAQVGIERTETDVDENISVNAIDGRHIGQMKRSEIHQKLPRGIYIVTTHNRSEKVVVD